MANPLFNALGGNQMPGALGMLNQLKNDPMGLLKKAGYNIPSNVTGPQQIVEYLTQSGQLSQAQLNQAQQMAQMFKK